MSSAPVNIEEMIRLFNIELDKKANLDDNILGEIRKLPDGRYKISINKNDHYYRKRFTMAHELGHFLLHGGLIGDGLNDNVAYRNVESGDFYNSHIGKEQETEANQFAASVLMPDDILKLIVFSDTFTNTDESIQTLSKKFQVSKEAMKIKVSDLLRRVNTNQYEDRRS